MDSWDNEVKFTNPLGPMASGAEQPPPEVLLLETAEHDGVQEIFSEAELFDMLRPMIKQSEGRVLTVEQEARIVYGMLDQDQNQELDEQELGDSIANALGQPLAPEALATLFRRVDTDQSQAISVQEFVAWWTAQSKRLEPVQDASTKVKLALKATTMINPHSVFRRNWDAIQLLLLVYVGTVVPWRICFGRDVALWSFLFFAELFIDLFFMADVVMNFRTAVITSNGDVLVDPKQVRNHYVRSWFVLDLVSCMPIGYAQYFQNPEGTTNSGQAGVRLVRVLRLAKLLRLARAIQVRNCLGVGNVKPARRLCPRSTSDYHAAQCACPLVCRHLSGGQKNFMHLWACTSSPSSSLW
jgi:hypothetical protein